MTVVLDASAMLAMLLDEPGGFHVEAAFAESMISAVNWSEVIQKADRHGIDVTALRDESQAVGLVVIPFDADDAEAAALMWQMGTNLSLADRACLALGMRLRAPVLTADRYWATLETGAEVRVIR